MCRSLLALGLTACVAAAAFSDSAARSAGACAAVESTSEDETKITVYVTKTGKNYYKSTCRHVAKGKTAITLAEAKKRGLEACSACGGK